ncbi:MAG: YkvA family protein [Candidatus Cyclobacteriaceae bacterium M3_2C_046]
MGNFNFASAKKKAGNIARDPERLHHLIRKAMAKFRRLEKNETERQDFGRKLNTFIRMLKAYVRGDYRVIPWKSVLLIVAGLVYFVNPMDVIPDFFPITGFLDDISLIIWIFSSIEKDIEDFKEWESIYS